MPKNIPLRSKINLRDPKEVKSWSHHLGVPRDELKKAVEKVGDSAPAVKKQLGAKDGA